MNGVVHFEKNGKKSIFFLLFFPYKLNTTLTIW